MKRIVGTKKGMLMHIVMPCMVITLVIALVGQDGYSRANVLFVNEDGGIASQYLLEELASKPDYNLKVLDNEKQLREAVIEDQGVAGVIIPAGYTEGILSGRVPKLQFYEMKLSEGSYTLRLMVSNLTQGLVSSASLIRNVSDNDDDQGTILAQMVTQTRKHNISGTVQDLELYSKPGLNSVTGFTLMFLMGLIGSSATQIMDDRRRRTMTRMFCAPVRAWEIALGNFLGSFAVGISQIAILLILSRYLVGYDYGVPIVLHFVILGAFMLVAMGISTAIAALIRSSQQLGMINSLIITPTCMLGGCFWPVSFMPDFMQKLANFVPQKWTIEAIEILAVGEGLSQITVPLIILGLMALVLLIFGSAVLRPNEANVH